MPARKSRTLDRPAWESFARNYRVAASALSRVGGAMLLTCSVKVHDQWAKVERRVDALGLKWSDKAMDQLGDDSGISRLFRRDLVFADDERRSYKWLAPPGKRRRELTRQEWLAIGDDVKRTRRAIWDLGFAWQEVSTIAESQLWFRTADRVDLLKSHLEDVCFDQHSDGEFFGRVFYGDPSDQNPQLLAFITAG